MCCYHKHNLNRLEYCHTRKYLIIVNTITLTVTLDNQTGFIGLHLSVCTPLLFEDPLTPYGFYPLRWVNQCLYIIDFYGLHFGFYGFQLLIKVRPLHHIHIDDRILIILIEFNRIPISDQKIIVSVRLM